MTTDFYTGVGPDIRKNVQLQLYVPEEGCILVTTAEPKFDDQKNALILIPKYNMYPHLAALLLKGIFAKKAKGLDTFAKHFGIKTEEIHHIEMDVFEIPLVVKEEISVQEAIREWDAKLQKRNNKILFSHLS